MAIRKSLVALLALIILLLIVFLVPRYFHKGDTGQNFARADIRYLTKALDSYFSSNGKYPTTEEGLDILSNSTIDRIPNDPWGEPYKYRQPGLHNRETFDLWSYGADLREGGKNENMDITNWD